MKQTYEIHAMEIITFEATQIFAAGQIGGTSTEAGETDTPYTSGDN